MRWSQRFVLGLVLLAGCGRGSSERALGPWAAATLPLYSGPNRALAFLQPVEGQGTCTVKGHVLLRGPRPDLRKLEEKLRQQMMQHPNGAQCLLAAAKEELPWLPWQINDKGGVANVYVWVQPPEGFFFKIDTLNKTWPEEVVLDVPACAFRQRATVLFPSYRDPLMPQRYLDTGQRVVVRNSSLLSHRLRWDDNATNQGENPFLIPGGSFTLPVKQTNNLIRFFCTIHPWMMAHARTFEHPFAAVTGPDGSYEIHNVPRGVPLRLVAWHEAAGSLTDPAGNETWFPKEDNVQDFEVQGVR